MKITLSTHPLSQIRTELLALPLFSIEPKTKNRLPRAIETLDRKLAGQIAHVLQSGDFKAKKNETLLLYPTRSIGAARILLLGLGNAKEFNFETLRQAAGTTVKATRKTDARKLSMLLPNVGRLNEFELANAATQGAILGGYQFECYRSEKTEGALKSLSLVLADETGAAKARSGIQHGRVIAESQNLARDLSNQPANGLPPAALARNAQRIAKEVGLRCQVFDEKELTQRKMGGILAVGQGSTNPPRLIVLEHKPKGRAKARIPTVCLIGKGITFDSGGISLKPGAGMQAMKHDMSGAAAVLGALRASALLALPLRVVGIVAAAENLPGGKAYRPSDVVTSLSGKTIEVHNTDAEGRIVLADALTYAQKTFAPDAMVDIATLTGACIIALGRTITGMLGSNQALMDQLSKAGERCAEPLWQLPLREEHHQQLKSKIADIVNVGGREAGTITGAAFLSAFTEDTPWAHLDIAGTADTEKPGAYQAFGATGVGVRLFLDLLENWCPLDGR